MRALLRVHSTATTGTIRGGVGHLGNAVRTRDLADGG
jgi:hypothetical protein